MPIEGDLKSLNLSSVLQLVAQERLIGVLKIKRKNEIVDIGFSEGEVTGAFYEKGANSERLETYLVRSGMIGKNVFEMIQEIHNETKRPIMNIILEDRYLTLSEVERIIKFKIQEVFDELFTWEEGEFKFEQASVIYPKSLIKIRVSTEGLILESARRYDEWPRIRNEIKSADLVFKRVERPELKLKPPEDEARVFSLLDGHRSVDDLVGISGLGKFHTYSCLYRLLSTGQIEVAYAKPTPAKARPKRHISLKFMKIPTSVAIIVLILLLEFIIGNYLASKQVLNFTIYNEELLDSGHEVYQNIFYYKHHRIPSVRESENIFQRYRKR